VRARLRLGLRQARDADDVAAAIPVAVRVRLVLADRLDVRLPAATEEGEEPPEHGGSVAERSDEF
jgi:hypothetical protein